MLTKEELEKIFRDIDDSIKHELPRTSKKKISRIEQTNVNDNDQILYDSSDNKDNLKEDESAPRRRNKTFKRKRRLIKRIRRSLLNLLQKLVFRKRSDYYKRLQAIKRQWVMFNSFKPKKSIFSEGRNAARLEEGS